MPDHNDTQYVPLKDFLAGQLGIKQEQAAPPPAHDEPAPPPPAPARQPAPDPEPLQRGGWGAWGRGRAEAADEEPEEDEEPEDEPEDDEERPHRPGRRAQRQRPGRAPDTAMVEGATIDALYTWGLRLAAVAMWGITFSGSVVTAHLGIATYRANYQVIAAQASSDLATWLALALMPQTLVGFGVQAVITIVQLRHRRRKRSWTYGIASGVSTGTTYYGYAPMLVPFFAPGVALLLAAAGTSLAGAHPSLASWRGQAQPLAELLAIPVAHLLTLVFSFLMDYLPEKVLIRH